MSYKRTYFTVADAARYAGVHRATVYRWIDIGDLDAVILSGVRYVARADMDKLLDDYEDEIESDGHESNDE